jgi:dihydrodipicolinate synthase/N-acetylneuraminate lyase
MRRRFSGVLGPITTPFGADESLDIASLKANIRAHFAAGLDGVLVAGSTGEAALLDEDERTRAVEAAREVVPTDRILLVGTGAESTRQCVARCRNAASAGGDAVLVVSPH